MKKFLKIKEINNILPHRYPFQMVDEIIEINENNIIGIKKIKKNEPYFKGHFPNNPIMPGVLQIEALAQTGGILVLKKIKNYKNYWTYLISINNCKFKKIVKPKNILILKCKLTHPIKIGFIKMKSQALIKNDIVCEVEISAKLVKK